ncbi:MAG: NAD-dependent epimerase/dehydratase family protein [Chromatiales bacterium]|nr:NAD-dependent epimerase/dehydratase family protein [Chromatiales bacterium]
MNNRTICVLGGTGFVGRHLVTRLANRGYKVKVLTRYPQRHREIEVLTRHGTDRGGRSRSHGAGRAFRRPRCRHQSGGMLHEYAGQSFRAVHADLPGKMVEACQAVGVKRLLHMSALHADAAKGPSQYLFTKGEGEQVAMQAQGLAVTCFKPSIIFGPNDNFCNQFANMLKFGPVLPLACPQCPLRAGLRRRRGGSLRESAGGRCDHRPELRTVRTARLHLRGSGRGHRPDAGLEAAWWSACSIRWRGCRRKSMGMLPVKIFTTDNYLSLQIDSVCGCNGLEALGITPQLGREHRARCTSPARPSAARTTKLRKEARRD